MAQQRKTILCIKVELPEGMWRLGAVVLVFCSAIVFLYILANWTAQVGASVWVISVIF